jgi:hypothetical protein
MVDWQIGEAPDGLGGCRLPYGQKSKLQQKRAVTPSRRSLTGCLLLPLLGRSWALVADRRGGELMEWGTHPGLHHRDREPANAVAE